MAAKGKKIPVRVLLLRNYRFSKEIFRTKFWSVIYTLHYGVSTFVSVRKKIDLKCTVEDGLCCLISSGRKFGLALRRGLPKKIIRAPRLRLERNKVDRTVTSFNYPPKLYVDDTRQTLTGDKSASTQ